MVVILLPSLQFLLGIVQRDERVEIEEADGLFLGESALLHVSHSLGG